MRSLAPSAAFALLAAAAPAVAGPSVTLNGVNIDGVTNQKFESCTVVIDERGDVHIQAKGYAVRIGEDGRPAASASSGGAALVSSASSAGDRVTRRYFIVTEQTPPGAPPDLDVFVNAQWIREVKASERQAVVEITKYLHTGANKITLAAARPPAAERAATNDAAVRIVVGEGNIGGDRVTIDLPLVQMERTAAEIESKADEFVIEAR